MTALVTGRRPKGNYGITKKTSARRGTRARYRSRGINLTVNLAPMIDMTFLLLIFFLVTSTFEQAEGILASQMPDTGPVTGVPLPISPIVLRITQTGPGHDDYRIEIDNFSITAKTFSELPEVLKTIQSQPGFDRDTPVVIVAKSDVKWDHLVSAWNAALRADCQRIAFGEP